MNPHHRSDRLRRYLPATVHDIQPFASDPAVVTVCGHCAHRDPNLTGFGPHTYLGVHRGLTLARVCDHPAHPLPDRTLHRAALYPRDCDPEFRIADQNVRATQARDVALPILTHEDGRVPGIYPPCPDCGGIVEWADTAWTRGIRRCARCGSLFGDSHYSSGPFQDPAS